MIIKNIILLILAISISLTMIAQENDNKIQSGSLSITMDGFENDNGMAFIAIYDSEANWLGKQTIGSIEKIENGKSIAHFENIAFGTYAVSCFHDENNNKKLDTGWFGIPTEPYACSQGAKGKFGPPKWKDAIFEINKDNINIEVKF